MAVTVPIFIKVASA